MYRLKKSKTIFFHTLKLFTKKRKKLTDAQRDEVHNTLRSFQESIVNRDVEGSFNLAKKCELLSRMHFKKSFFDHIFELIFALLFALIVATIVRQMWFELYEIPSGSMRPTLLEKDRLVVSKTQFGINVPLSLKHFVFEPDEVKRGGIIVFSGEDMDIPDNLYNYFYIFPGYKQYVKRLMGKPGDTLYFYGGQIYGIDRDGKDITPALQPHELSHIAHVPFISFDGDVKIPNPKAQGISSPVVYYQMNMPVAKLYASGFNQIKGEVIYSTSQYEKPVDQYEDLWGFKNYAMAQIVREKGNYVLELSHSPNFHNASIQQDHYGKFVPKMGLYKSYLNLDKGLLQKLFASLYTDRFVVKDGYMRRASQISPPIRPGVKNYYPQVNGVPNGTYEFEDGVLYQVYWQGVRKEAPKDHPLAQFNEERTALLFNIGMEFDVRFLPESLYDVLPARYAFFKENGLYLMSKEIIPHDDPHMTKYVNREMEREKSTNGHYLPFVDQGAPYTNDGKLDVERIKRAGLRIPEGHYLGLGDNYATSADSRKFGFIPAENLKGTPDLLFWPVGPRMGFIDQPMYALLTLPRLIIWGLAAIVFIIWAIVSGKRHALPRKIPR